MSLRVLALALALALALPATGAEPPVPAAPKGPRAEKARAYFTDSILYDQDGRAVRFYSDVLEGNVVVVNFINKSNAADQRV